MTDTRTVVTVHPIFSPDFTVSVGENARVIQHAGTNVVCYDATDFTVTDGALVIMNRSDTTDDGRIGILRELAAWAPGTWARAEVTEAPAALAEPEEPDAGPGTFEVYEDATGNYRFNLRDGDGEYLASGQGYAIRKNAHAGVAAVQRAAKGAPIIDLEHE